MVNDNEIIKALEVESVPSEINCVHGEYIESCGIYCTKKRANAEYCHDCKEHSMAYYGRRAKATLDLINRQRAEIEDLKDSNEHLAVFLEEARAELERLHSEVKEKTETIDFLKDQAVGWSIDFCNLKAKLDTAKTEAIKEFAERLKKETLFDSGWGVIQPDVIDNLVKEMTEGAE